MLTVQVKGKKYELESETFFSKGLVALGNYQAKLGDHKEKPTGEFTRSYDLMFPDGSTRTLLSSAKWNSLTCPSSTRITLDSVLSPASRIVVCARCHETDEIKPDVKNKASNRRAATEQPAPEFDSCGVRHVQSTWNQAQSRDIDDRKAWLRRKCCRYPQRDREPVPPEG